jgi:rhodanese-related sulfurtransferase
MRFRLLPLSLVLPAVAALAADVPRLTAPEAAARLQAGDAVLVDVREPSEWKETGVAAPAVLLEKSDFDGAKAAWAPFLKKVGKDRTIILYCRSGGRSGRVAETLAAQGYTVVNAGAFKDWAAAGLPTRRVE